MKFDGGPASLQAEISELRTQKRGSGAGANPKALAKMSTMESLIYEQSVFKNRIATCATVSMQ